MDAKRSGFALAALVGASLVMTLDAPGLVTATATPTTARMASGAHIVVPFIADDYARAVAEARARKVPIFIEAWAPW